MKPTYMHALPLLPHVSFVADGARCAVYSDQHLAFDGAIADDLKRALSTCGVRLERVVLKYPNVHWCAAGLLSRVSQCRGRTRVKKGSG